MISAPSRSKIDPDVLRQMWEAGASSSAIAERFGVQYPAVNIAAKKLGLPSRRHGAAVGVVRQRKPEPVKAPERPSTYAAICADAEREGITIRQAMQRHHRAAINEGAGR